MSTRFFEAVLNRKIEEINKLLDEGQDVNAVDREYEETALSMACANGYLDICERLVEHPDIVIDKRVNWLTSLHKAVCSGNLEICKLLVNHGADIKAKGSKLLFKGNLSIFKLYQILL